MNDAINAQDTLLDWIDINKLSWFDLSYNPEAIELLEANQDKIHWNGLSQNPAIFKSYYKTNEYVLK